MRVGGRSEVKFVWAWALVLLGVAGCQPNSGSLGSSSLSQTAFVTAVPSIEGMVQASVGGRQTLYVAFNGLGLQQIRDLQITGGLALPSGWSGPSTFSCSEIGRDRLCELPLTYTPTSSGSGTLALNFSYIDEAGSTHSGSLRIPYSSSSNNNIVATTAPTGQINAVIGAGSQSVQVAFTTDDGNPATNFALTSSLSSLPAGWSSSASAFSCASVSTGNGCELSLSYAPTAIGSGVLTLNYNYTDNAGQSKSGALNIPYASATNNSVIGTVAPSGQIAVSLGGSQSVSVTFNTNDSNGATNLSLTSDLASLPSGWSSASGSFSCSSISTGNGCQLSLTFAPTAVASGSLTLQFSYTNNAGDQMSGLVLIPYVASTNNNVVASPSPSGQIEAVIGAAAQAVSVTFTTDDGNLASNLALTSDLSSLPSGWSSSSGSSFGCASVSIGAACQLSLSYAPPAVGNGTLNLSFSYFDDAGVAKSGTVSLPYLATTNDTVIGTAAPSGTVNVAVNASQTVTVTFASSDGNIATGLAVTSNLGALPSGWSSGSGSFGCASVSSGTGCQLSLSYAPSAAASGTLSLNYSYTNNAGSPESGSVSIPYTSNATVGGTVTGLNGTVSLQDNGTDTLVLSGNGSFSFATALASGASYNVTVSAQPAGQTCSVANGSGTVSADVTGVTVSCSTNTYSIGGSISGLTAGGLVLTDEGGNPLPVSSGASSFSFSSQIGYGASYAVAVGTQPTGQTCTVASGSGTVNGTVSSVSVICSTNTFGIGGSISGLSQNGLVLTDNGGNFLSLASGSTSFAFTIPLSYGSSYSVAVGTQPTGQTCTVGSSSGTVTGTVTSVSVTCTANTYSIGGSISGLSHSGLVLTDNGGNALPVSSGSSSFTFSNQLAYGASYAAAVSTQPTGQTCSVGSASGTVTGTVTSVSVTCTTNTFSIGGSISGLSASGLVLTDNGGNPLTVPPGSSSFTFSTQLSYGATYAVAVSTQPTGKLCTVASGSGTVTATVTSVSVSCVASFTLGGTISGLNVSNVVLASGSATVTVAAGSSSWVFASSFASGSAYSVTVQTQPAGETCQVTSGASGTLSANVNNVTVVCAFGLWTWQSGSNATNVDGVYGTEGTASPSNVPGGRGSSNTWVDSAGNLWLFGGYGYDSTGSGGFLNDLWKFSPSSGQWTWMGGSNAYNVSGVYGTKGTAAASNMPGARDRAASWVDSSGNFWLFGGAGNSVSFNDLWKFSPSSGEWTWVSGGNGTNANGVYGTEGTASASNVPGARSLTSSWIDSSGNLWLFGGNGYASTGGSGDLNDLWKFSPSSGQWTWVSGANAINNNGVYGTQGIASASNVPGGRGTYTCWIDSSGNLWLFGGYGYGASGGSGDLNDLWKFSPSSGQWTWVSGANAINNNGVYGTQGIASTSNMPGGRWLSKSWTDSAGNLWLFGGGGYGATGGSGELNDLWEFSPSTGEWTWISGANSINNIGVYGTLGTGSASNVPGGRQQANSWIDSSGNLWLSGGAGYGASGGSGELNDLWEFTPVL